MRIQTGWADSGLLFGNNARYYDAPTGRFISPDAVVPNASNPQSLNRYAYVQNAPTEAIDPDGHFAFFIPVIVGAIIGAYSAGHASNWNSDAVLRGAAVGAIGGAVGAGVGAGAMSVTGSAALSGVIGGAAGGTTAGYTGAAMFGGNRGIAMEQGALWGGVSGGLSQELVIKGIPDAAAQSLSGYLSGHWQGGRREARGDSAYSFVGSILGAALRMQFGLDSAGRLPVKESTEWQTRFNSTQQTNVLTPAMQTKNWFFVLLGFLSGGFEHTWHSQDYLHYERYNGYPRYYYPVEENVPFPGEASYLDSNFDLFQNNCTTRVGYPSPDAYQANFNYRGPASYWHD